MDQNSSNSELLSLEFIKNMHEQFATYKSSIDNTINITDFKIIIKELGYSPTYTELNNIIVEVGSRIDFVYFLVIIGRIMKEMNDDKYKKELLLSFNLLDRDSNGTIEIDELVNCGRDTIEKQQLREIFLYIDLDHNGHITMEEYKHFLQVKT